VVHAQTLAMHAGRSLGIFGPNGSGKTTLVRGITALLPPMSGQVSRPKGLRFGYLPQHRSMELHWPMSGLDAAMMALSARRRLGWVDGQTRCLQDVMQRLEVSALAHRPFARLSGGQQQRLLLAGALAADPQVLILDEPTDGLDIRSCRIFIDILKEAKGRGLSTAMISHDFQELLDLADDIAWVHASESPDQPSEVEVIDTTAFAARLAVGRQPA
jgi:ABC-type Mn2+/Zn2+ transport system ATPase subunit